MKAFEFNNVSFIRDKKSLLNNVSWTVESSENWAILGLNGAGKTLLLQLICGYLWPSKGRLAVLDQVFGQASIRVAKTDRLGQYCFTVPYEKLGIGRKNCSFRKICKYRHLSTLYPRRTRSSQSNSKKCWRRILDR